MKSLNFFFKGEMEEVEVDSVHNISESVPESEQEETFDGRVMIDKTRVVFEKNSCENQHFRMGASFLIHVFKMN